MKTTALILLAFFGAAAAIKCETLSFDTSCCSLDPVQPKGGFGSVLQNYVCTDCASWGNFNQTFMQAFGAMGDMVPSAASYVGSKGSGMGSFRAGPFAPPRLAPLWPRKCAAGSPMKPLPRNKASTF